MIKNYRTKQPYDSFELSFRETVLLIQKKIPTLGLRQPLVVGLLHFLQRGW